MGFDLAVQANHAYSMGVASFGLSHTLLRRGHIADAINVLERGYEQIKLHSVEAVFDQVVSRLCYAYAKAGRGEEARAIGPSEIADFSFLSSTHFLLAAVGIQSDRIELTLRQTGEAHQRANLRGERGNVAWMEHLFGDIVMSDSSPELSAAEKHYRTAAAIADELSMRPLLVECRLGRDRCPACRPRERSTIAVSVSTYDGGRYGYRICGRQGTRIFASDLSNCPVESPCFCCSA